MNPTIERLRDAVNRHDPAGMAALFAPDYQSQQPVHPNRGFGGSGQVEANWTEMFAGVPDLKAEVIAAATDGFTCWSEWSWSGRHTDGTDFAMKGCIVMGLRDDGAIELDDHRAANASPCRLTVRFGPGRPTRWKNESRRRRVDRAVRESGTPDRIAGAGRCAARAPIAETALELGQLGRPVGGLERSRPEIELRQHGVRVRAVVFVVDHIDGLDQLRIERGVGPSLPPLGERLGERL